MPSNDHITSFLVVISVVGTIGNLIVAFVYWQKRDKQTSTFFILVLAFIDFTVCFILVPLTIYMEKILFETNSLILCKAYFFLTTTTVPSSSLLMTAIAIDRYFCICQANKNVLTLQKTKVIGVILLFISGLLGVIPALASIVQPNSGGSTNSTQNGNQTSSTEDYDTSSISNELENRYDISSSSLSSNLTSNLTSYQCTVNHDSTSQFAFLIMPFKFVYDFVFVASVITITSLYVLIYKEIYTRRKAKRDRRRELMNNKYLNGGGGALPVDAHDDENCACYRICFCFASEPIKNEEPDLNGNYSVF
jgi:cholecystokinin A receptor